MILFSSAFLSGAVGVKTISYFYLDKLLLPSASWNQPEYDGTLFPRKNISILKCVFLGALPIVCFLTFFQKNDHENLRRGGGGCGGVTPVIMCRCMFTIRGLLLKCSKKWLK